MKQNFLGKDKDVKSPHNTHKKLLLRRKIVSLYRGRLVHVGIRQSKFTIR